MEFNIEIRKRQLKSLKQYIHSAEDNVKAVLQTLGWNSKKLLEKEEPKIVCPVNSNHLIAYKTSEKHLESCTLHTLGYNSKDQFLSEPSEPSKCSIILNTAKKAEILTATKCSKSEFKTVWNGRDPDPMTANRLTSTFSTDERSALYDYCIKHTESPPKPEEFTLDISELKDKSHLSEKERLALERDAKRRRAKYKSVHTSKKNQTEIMRELIDNQMSLYSQWIERKQEQETKERDQKLKKEKEKNYLNESHSSNQYHYIETTYSQNGMNNQVDQSNVQWPAISENYGNPYYSNVQGAQGVITDWSHVYQGGVNTDIYSDSGQYQAQDGEYQPVTFQSTNNPYTETTAVPTEENNGHVLPNSYNEQYSNKIKPKDYSGSKERFREQSYEKKLRERRHEIEKRHMSKEKKRDRRH